MFQCGSPSRIDSEAPEAPHTKNGVVIRSVTVTQKIDRNRPHYKVIFQQRYSTGDTSDSIENGSGDIYRYIDLVQVWL